VLAEGIFESRQHKRIVAFVTVGFSAGYQIAAACSEVVLQPGGWVGSLGGVVLPAQDGRILDELVMYASTSAEKAGARQMLQASESEREQYERMAQEAETRLIAAVARYRGISEDQVRRDFGGGRYVPAHEALRRRMVDRIGVVEGLSALDLATVPGLLPELQKGSI